MREATHSHFSPVLPQEVGFELFVHPNETVKLWETILDAGKPFGMKPAGLGARDSARIEAGLPLFGHVRGGGQGDSNGSNRSLPPSSSRRSWRARSSCR